MSHNNRIDQITVLRLTIAIYRSGSSRYHLYVFPSRSSRLRLLRLAWLQRMRFHRVRSGSVRGWLLFPYA